MTTMQTIQQDSMEGNKFKFEYLSNGNREGGDLKNIKR